MKIILTTLNARYTHSSLALRYLYANLKELKDNTQIVEHTINDNIHEIAEKLLKSNPTFICIGVYIWNSSQVSQLVKIIKKISPDTTIILGGPEVSHLPIRGDFDCVDHIIQGEGELSLYNLLRAKINGNLNENKVILNKLLQLDEIKLPYKYYTDHDIKHRVIYVEASRGCPFTCEFCLSSIDRKVRHFNLSDFLDSLSQLWDRGARNFKFIDRTFNISLQYSLDILDFFLKKSDGFLVHFEVIPENFPVQLREKILQFKPGTLQLEVGIQTLQEDIARNINRSMNMAKIKDNLKFLQEQTHAHLHVDLIIGLPEETLVKFGENLNTLISLTDCEVQLGILKKLSGTTIDRHDIQHSMIYSDEPPYELLQNDNINFLEMQEMKRFARYWDLMFNSGNFKKTVKMLWEDGDVFNGFLHYSRWLYSRSLSTHQISLNRLTEYFYEYLTELKDKESELIRLSLIDDITRQSGRKLPSFLRNGTKEKSIKSVSSNFGKRQKRHIVD